MSLDVYLIGDEFAAPAEGSGIFIRENGRTFEISEAEWRERNPGRIPVRHLPTEPSAELFSANITHNLGHMAARAGLYDALWRPDEHGWKVAGDLIAPIERGVAALKAKPAAFKVYNPENGWGDYDGLLEFAEGYLVACKRWPAAKVEVSR